MSARTTYPSYRDSGVDFLGSIPTSWAATRIANVFEERKVFNHPDELLLSIDRYRGIIKQSDTGRKVRAPKDRAGYKLIEEGELGYNILNAFMGSVGVSRYRGIVSPAYAVARLRTQQEPWYFHYMLRTELYQRQFNRFSYGIMYERNRLYYDRFKAIPIPVPPREDQEKIVAYLRAQDAQIARLIKAKRDLIGVLTEQKLRIIDHAVTRGLNAQVALKHSGIDWLGDVPGHWDIALLKHVADVRFSGVDKHSHDHEIPVRLCNYTDVYKNDKITSDMDLMRATATAGEIARLTLKAGDVIITKDSETPDDIAVPGWVPEDLPGVVCAYHLGLLRPDPGRIEGEFLFRAIGSARIAEQFHVLATGVTRFALGKHDVKNAVVALPPVEEQKAICKWIDDECKPLEEAILRAEEEIKLIREYRDRQIADVVTGQVDVRGWVPSPDDVVCDGDLAALGDEEAGSTEEDAANADG